MILMSLLGGAGDASAGARKTLAELVERKDPAWPILQQAVADAHGRARLLPTTEIASIGPSSADTMGTNASTPHSRNLPTRVMPGSRNRASYQMVSGV